MRNLLLQLQQLNKRIQDSDFCKEMKATIKEINERSGKPLYEQTPEFMYRLEPNRSRVDIHIDIDINIEEVDREAPKEEDP